MIFIKHLNIIMEIMVIMDSRGIFDIDLFISLMLLIMIFSAMLSFSTQEHSAMEENQNRRIARVVVMDVSTIIMDVYAGGDGFSRKYELPNKINKQTYVLWINSSGVYLNSHNQVTYAQLPSGIISQSKKYTLKPGHVYEFSNINESIYITQHNR